MRLFKYFIRFTDLVYRVPVVCQSSVSLICILFILEFAATSLRRKGGDIYTRHDGSQTYVCITHVQGVLKGMLMAKLHLQTSGLRGSVFLKALQVTVPPGLRTSTRADC